MVRSDERVPAGFSSVQIDGIAWRVFAARGAEQDIQVFVGEQMASRDSILWAILRSTLSPVLVALPLLALAVWWAVRQGVAPLRNLGRTLAARQPQALAPIVIDHAPAEMQPMLDALNDLFARIATLMESERRFTADAAHELRTPIAAIRTQAQVALGEADAGQRRHALEATLEGCDRATRLVEQLLTLARLESGASTASQRLEMGPLLRRVVAALAPQAIQKGQQIEVEAQDGCLLDGDDTLLSVLVRNLVDNAIRYSPAGARIRLTLQKSADRIELGVEDSGPGMQAADIDHLGERFFRVIGSGQGGSGLGWSIVRRIAAAHRAELRIEPSGELGGLSIRVTWLAAS
jgi:two-component system sensor histidine kinase QseC